MAGTGGGAGVGADGAATEDSLSRQFIDFQGREGDPVRTPICIQCALLSQHPARTLFASSAHSWVSGKGFWEGKGFRVFRVQGLGVQAFRV